MLLDDGVEGVVQRVVQVLVVQDQGVGSEDLAEEKDVSERRQNRGLRRRGAEERCAETFMSLANVS